MLAISQGQLQLLSGVDVSLFNGLGNNMELEVANFH